MKRLSDPTLWIVVLPLCALVLGVVALSVAANERAAVQEIVWAQSVVDYRAGAGTIGANFSDPQNALGPVDSRIVALGNAQSPSAPPADPAACEAALILSFGEYGLVDGEGDDLTIYELAGGGLAEPIWVYIGGEATGWRYVGESAGGKDSLDISAVAEPTDSFNLVALCDVPDGDTTIGATPGPDIDAVSADNASQVGLVLQAQGPGWFVDLDPGLASRHVLAPLVAFQDLLVQPPALIQFQCPADTPLEDCTAYLIVKATCGGEVTLANPLFFWYPFPQPTLRDLTIPYSLLNVQRYFGYCTERSGRSAVAAEPIAEFSLQEGGARFLVVEEAWRFALQSPAATVYSAGNNHFTMVHDPALGASTIRVLGGSVEVDPSAPGADPFPLSAGQQVVVSADGAGPVTDSAQVFLPVTMQ